MLSAVELGVIFSFLSDDDVKEARGVDNFWWQVSKSYKMKRPIEWASAINNPKRKYDWLILPIGLDNIPSSYESTLSKRSPIDLSLFPHNCSKVVFVGDWRQSDPSVLPKHITHMYFKTRRLGLGLCDLKYVKPLFGSKTKGFPTNLRFLRVGEIDLKGIDWSSMPSTLTHLMVDLDSPISFDFSFVPSSVTHLRVTYSNFFIGNGEGCPWDMLPPTVKVLVLDYCYNETVDHLSTIPDTLQCLVIGVWYRECGQTQSVLNLDECTELSVYYNGQTINKNKPTVDLSGSPTRYMWLDYIKQQDPKYFYAEGRLPFLLRYDLSNFTDEDTRELMKIDFTVDVKTANLPTRCILQLVIL